VKQEIHIDISSRPGRAAFTDARASEFVVRRFDCDGWSSADQAELEAWLAESSANHTAFLRLKSAWMRANRLDALRPATMREGLNKSQFSFGHRLKLAASAAVLLASLVTGAGLFLSQPSSQTFSTKVGEQSHLQLPDGTRIELTTNTVLRVARNGNHRKAWLDKGEAFFQVVHDAKHPFELEALNFRIVDLGTEFSVRRDADRIRVAVLTGGVWLGSPGTKGGNGTVRMTAGQVAVADRNSIRVTRASVPAISDLLGWRSGVLVFRYAPMTEVAAEFNRYNTDRIVIDDPRVANMIVSARLQAKDVSAFARMAHDFMGLQVRRTANEIHISRQGQ